MGRDSYKMNKAFNASYIKKIADYLKACAFEGDYFGLRTDAYISFLENRLRWQNEHIKNLEIENNKLQRKWKRSEKEASDAIRNYYKAQDEINKLYNLVLDTYYSLNQVTVK